MANYTKGTETKRQLVDCVYRMLQKQDASALTVRDIAASQGLSPAAIYRHFESLDYLIVVASIRMLQNYMEDYAALMDSNADALSVYIEGWELFDRYAFDRPDIYYRLFWGEYNSRMDDALQDYFELFPLEASERSAAHVYLVMFDADMTKREEIALHRVAQEGLISEKDIFFFSRSNALIARGLISNAMGASAKKRAALLEECNALIRANMERVGKKAA